MINDRYKIISLIGEGRSKVFLCRDLFNDNRELAIKILPADVSDTEEEFFKEEFLTLKRLNHPNIVKCGEYGTVVGIGPNEKKFSINRGSNFFTLEYINGKDLAESLIEFDEVDLTKILAQICYVLYYLHSSNYIYYDLKFENILVVKDHEKPLVKFIDFGLTRNITSNEKTAKRGTAEFMAPELLSEGEIDHKIDFYSLGVIFYKLVYGKFPASGDSEIDIFKQHLEVDFNFPGADYSDNLIAVIKKLLLKNPQDRYTHALEILTDLHLPFDEEQLSQWIPPQVFVINNIVLSIKGYLSNNEPEDILVIKGVEGAGKTHTAEEIYYNSENVVLIKANNPGSVTPLWKIILREIFYSTFINPSLTDTLRDQIEKILHDDFENLLDELRAVFISLSNNFEFIIIFDDFDKYDPLTLELLADIIPILLVNNIRIILTEDQSSNVHSTLIESSNELHIAPFSEQELTSLLEKTLSTAFPIEEIKKNILEYSDLFPGMILNSLKNFFFFKAFKFDVKGVNLDLGSEKIDLLKGNQNDIYHLRLKELNNEEQQASQMLSMLDVDVPNSILALLLNKEDVETTEITRNLQLKNILNTTISTDNSFTSNGLKEFIYHNVIGKKQKHLHVANVLYNEVEEFNKNEIARQFELAEEYMRTFLIINKEVEAAEKMSAHSYQKKLLLHLLELPLEEKAIDLTKYKLSQTLYKLKDNSASLEVTNELLEKDLGEERRTALLIQKGGCSVRLGEFAAGVEIYNSLLPKIMEQQSKNRLIVEIASAEVFLNEYNKAEEKCLEIIENDEVVHQLKAKCLNILGIIQFQKSGNLDGAIKYFSEALVISEENMMKMNETEIETNIGNIYSMKGDYAKAEFHWQNALKKNSTIGSLSLEATLLMNYGILNFNKMEFEKSIENNKRAASIFRSLGNKANEGLILTNLGEAFLMGCEYDNAQRILVKGKQIFVNLNDKVEISEILLLLGKLYFYLNDNKGLLETVSEFEMLLKNEDATDRQKNNLEFLVKLSELNSNEQEPNLESLVHLRDRYLNKNDFGQYIHSNYLLVKSLIKQEKYELALEELNSGKFLEQIESKPLFSSERIYLLSVISTRIKREDLEPQIDYLEAAYNKLKDKSISELTWLVLLALAETYLQRGFMKKANELILLCKSLIDHIALNIKNVRQRNSYLAFHERKGAIEKLDVWINYIK